MSRAPNGGVSRRSTPALVITTALALLVAVLAGPSNAQTEPPPDAGPGSSSAGQGTEAEALRELGTCVASSNELLVLFLIDESGSLRETDPQASRVTAIQSALSSLHSLSDRPEAAAAPRVEVKFASFGLDYRSRNDEWVVLDGETSDFLSRAAGAFESLTGGFDTDYVLALEGAQRELTTRVAELTEAGGEAPCQLLLWFTDGRFDVAKRDTDERRSSFGEEKPWAPGVSIRTDDDVRRVLDVGRRRLCGGRGVDRPVVDALRSDGVTTLAIALSAQLRRSDQVFLEALAAGDAGGTTCGETGERAVGEYLPADSLNQLIAEFNGAIEDLEGTEVPSDGPLVPCADEPAPECSRSFELTAGLRQFNLLGLADGRDLVVALTSPTGETMQIPSPEDGSRSLSDVDLEWEWLDDSVLSLQGRLGVESSAWAGEWTVSFLDPTGEATVVDSQIYLYGNLRPAVPGDTAVTLGETTEIPISVRAEDGTPSVPDELIESVGLTATIDSDTASEPVEVVDQGGGEFLALYEPPDDLSDREVDAVVTLDVTTASGFALDPVVRQFTLPVRIPPVYPSVKETSLNLGSIQGTDAATARLEVLASPLSDGCIWLEEANIVDVPDGVQSIRTETDAEGEGDCLSVPEGEDQTLTIRFRPDEAGDGRVRGSVQLMVSSEREGASRPIDLDLQFSMTEPPISCFFCVLLALLVPGVLIPLAVLWFMKRSSAKFAPPGRHRAGGVDVSVTDTGVITRRDGSPLALRGADAPTAIVGLEMHERVREFAWPDAGLSFEARTGWNVFTPPDAIGGPTAVPSNRRFAAGQTSASVGRVIDDGRTFTFPLSVSGAWILDVDVNDLGDRPDVAIGGSEDASVPGRLWFFIDDGVDPNQEAALLGAAVLEQLPVAFDRLRAVAKVETQAAAPAGHRAEDVDAGAAGEQVAPVDTRSGDSEIDEVWGAPPPPRAPDGDDDEVWGTGETGGSAPGAFDPDDDVPDF